MGERVKVFRPAKAEQHDVFEVISLTQETPMEGRVGVDFFHVKAGQRSTIHAHEMSDTLLVALSGKGIVVIDGVEYPLAHQSRIWFDKGLYHGVITAQKDLLALSVQIPGIKIRDETGNIRVDLMPLQPGGSNG